MTFLHGRFDGLNHLHLPVERVGVAHGLHLHTAPLEKSDTDPRATEPCGHFVAQCHGGFQKPRGSIDRIQHLQNTPQAIHALKMHVRGQLQFMVVEQQRGRFQTGMTQ